MLEFMWRWRVLLGIAAFLVIAGSIYVTADERIGLSKVEELLRDGVAPLQGLFIRISLSVQHVWHGIIHWQEIAAENARLQELVAKLQQENNQLRQYQQENEVLRDALGFARVAPYNLLAAEVVGRSPDNWYDTIILNRGRVDGVRPKMPVITSRGIVGKVQAVTAHTATVLLIVDPKSAVGAMVRRTREPVLVEGNAEDPTTCVVRPLVREPDLRRGDRIVTSGLSQIFPPGLQIGYVDKVVPGKYGLSSTGYLRPWVDLAKLQFVFIVQGTAEGEAVQDSKAGNAPNIAGGGDGS